MTFKTKLHYKFDFEIVLENTRLPFPWVFASLKDTSQRLTIKVML